MEYRREIDGLRALAVIPVILFHAGFQAFSGGFVGVDVFFVISGYLITSIILAESQAGTFSIVNFYERRARRILPTLFLVLVLCLPLAWIWLLPVDMKSFSQSLVAVSLYASNILFWLKIGYFETAESIPLLHTWSLAVEEQYYLVFPMFLMLFWKLGQRWILMLLVVVAALSLVAAQLSSVTHPNLAFFLLPTRSWELLIGAFAAFYFDMNGASDRTQSSFRHFGNSAGEFLSLFGLILITYSVVAFDKKTPFPGVYALVPTIGSVLIIVFATSRTLVGKLLGNKVFVGVGLISYSAYLWHQPIFVFARLSSLQEPDKLIFAFLSISSLLLAYLSWKYVETPFRDRVRFSRKQIFTYSVLGSFFFIGFGLFGHFSNGVLNRSSPSYLPENYLYLASSTPFQLKGVDGNLCVSETASICKVRQESGAKNVLLVGDSHSSDYSVEFRHLADQRRLNAWQFSIGGCGFLSSQSKKNIGECGKAVELLKKVLAENKFQKIIFVVNLYGHTSNSDEQTLRSDMDSMSRLIADMAATGAEVVMFSPRYYLSSEPMRAALLNRLGDVRVEKGPTFDYVNARMSSVAAIKNVRVFDERDYLVGLGGGSVSSFNGHSMSGAPLYRDTHHLTNYGAEQVFSKLISSLDI